MAHRRKFHFSLHFGGLLFTLIFGALFISLGIWQWQKGLYKSNLENQFRLNTAGPVLTQERITLVHTLNLKAFNSLHFRRLELRGHYDNAHNFLLDNQIRHHQLGYEILTPFFLKANQLLLIDRGWVAQTDSRNQLPLITPIQGPQKIIGMINFPSSKIFVLSQLEDSSGWPRVIEALDMKKIASILAQPLYPFVLILNPPANYQLHASKNYGYAIQWFSLACALVIIFLYWCVRREVHER